MNDETEFDTWLSRQLPAVPLADAGFTLALTARMARHRRRRQAAWIAAVAIAVVVVTILEQLLPPLELPQAALTPESVVAALVLATLCGLAWIGAESQLPDGSRVQHT